MKENVILRDRRQPGVAGAAGEECSALKMSVHEGPWMPYWGVWTWSCNPCLPACLAHPYRVASTVKAINLTSAKFWNWSSIDHLELPGPSLEAGGCQSRQSQLTSQKPSGGQIVSAPAHAFSFSVYWRSRRFIGYFCFIATWASKKAL